jgi:nitrite reductase (cytochrome c-552)
MDALMALIDDIKTAAAGGAAPAGIEEARKFQRKAQFLLDFVEAENSTGFHAPQEAARLLTLSVDYSRRGEMAIRTVPVPQTASH